MKLLYGRGVSEPCAAFWAHGAPTNQDYYDSSLLHSCKLVAGEMPNVLQEALTLVVGDHMNIILACVLRSRHGARVYRQQQKLKSCQEALGWPACSPQCSGARVGAMDSFVGTAMGHGGA